MWYPGVGNEGEGCAKKEKKNPSIPVCRHLTHTMITVNLPPTLLFPVYPGANGCSRADDRTEGQGHIDMQSSHPVPGCPPVLTEPPSSEMHTEALNIPPFVVCNLYLN